MRALFLWETLSGYAWYTLSALATSLHSSGRKPGALSRILVVKTDHLGDLLLCLPAVRALALREPQAEIGLAVGSWNVPIAERLPWVSEVHAFDSPRTTRHGNPSPEQRLPEILSLGWDLVVDLTNDRGATIAAFSRPSRHRVDLGTYRLREKVRAVLGRGPGLRETHVAEVFHRAMGLEPPRPIPPEGIVLRDQDRDAAGRAVSRGWPGDRPIAAIHAGAGWKFRRWPGMRFSQVARGLEEKGLSVFLVGGEADREVSSAVAASAGLSPERNLAGSLELAATAAVLERAAVVCANDGGPMHLAAAMGTPVVAVFGPTSPVLFGPLGESSVAFWRRRDCAPCEQRHCIWGRALCLEPVETSEVLDACVRAAGLPS